MSTAKPAHKILLVEDSFIWLNLLEEICRQFDWEYVSVNDGEEALEHIKKGEAFSVIVSDLLMPKMNGLELLEAVKQFPEYKNVPFILQTAIDKEETIAKGIELGAYYYLTKPLNFKIVGEVLESAYKDYTKFLSLQGDLESSSLAIQLIKNASMEVKTPTEARALASLISKNSVNPSQVAIAVFELLINAIEHGNLEISYDDKTRLIESRSLTNEVERRLNLEKYSDRVVQVNYSTHNDEITVNIKDMGNGFDFEKYLEFDPMRLLDSHGRGIMMANNANLNSLHYSENGTCVEIKFK